MWESRAGTAHTDTREVSVVPLLFTAPVVVFDGHMHGKQFQWRGEDGSWTVYGGRGNGK